MTRMYDQLFELIRQTYPNFADRWRLSREQFGPQWEQEFDLHMGNAFGEVEGPRWDDAVTGYAEFCTDALRAQVFFERYGHYQASSYREVTELCYQNPDYMNRRYLPGQYISHYVWPHHHEMLRRFLDELLPLVGDRTPLFFEVGVGCGMYSQKILERIPGSRGIGFDISEYALAFTEQMVEAHGYGERYEIRLQNIIEDPPQEQADLVVSQEVLEHLEDPQAFIHGLYAATRPGGWAYITAAINAGHTDHIYLYRSPGQVEDQIMQAGFTIVDQQLESNYENKPVSVRPTLAGFLARKPE